ncbi:MAG: LysM peptidoglycan-binding domain-containing protein, partial [Anaerolineales bacterium]
MSNSPKQLKISESKLPGFIDQMGIFTFLGLIASIIFMIAAILITFRGQAAAAFVPEPTEIPIDFGEAHTVNEVSVPSFSVNGDSQSVSRSTYYQTNRSDNSAYQVEDYTVQDLDSLFGIAEAHNIEPETLLWANEDEIVNVDELSPGMHLTIPPVDGVYYQWTTADTLESVAKEYEVSVDDILNWPGNEFTDLTNPVIEPGTYIMIPGGEGDFQSWVMPTVATGTSGVDTSVYGPGYCAGDYSGAYGTGTFIWPTPIHTLTGNDFWDGHLAVDLAT